MDLSLSKTDPEGGHSMVKNTGGGGSIAKNTGEGLAR